MIGNLKIWLLAGIASLLLTACHTTPQHSHSGFLGDYSHMNESSLGSGKEAMRWVMPGFHLSDYEGIYFTPLTWYPVAKPNSRVNQATIDRTLNYANNRVMEALADRLPLVPKPIGNTLIFKGALTAIGAKKEDVNSYEMIPVANILASTMVPVTPHKQYPTLFFEGEFVDAASGKVVVKTVRRGFGKSVKNDNAPINASELKSAIDGMMGEVTIFR
ncbi:MAG: DUF3313 domain-containing protein [Enterobacteriaceae bacterium]